MKKISNVLLSVSILLITLMLFVVEYNKGEEVYKNKPNTFKTNNSLAIMLDDGNGNYNPSDSNAFPTSGYTFNSELSKCENGGEVTWDDTNKKVIVSSNVSDKCYIYFDKEPVTLANHIIGLYTTQGANNLYHHDGSFITDTDIIEYYSGDILLNKGSVYDANDGSYRYAGSYETTQNWVCFGTDNEKCDDEHLYRIIGVFEDQVKLIKAYEGTVDSLGTTHNYLANPHTSYYKGKLNQLPEYYWSGSSIIQSNDWTASKLNTDILNGTYLTKLNLDENNWVNKISNYEWKIGGNNDQKLILLPVTTYKNEIVSPSITTTVKAKVGLMYISDYGFASTPDNWTTRLWDFGNSLNWNNNWMFLGINEWTITPLINSNSNETFTFSSTGSISYTGSGNAFNVVRPTFYLNSNVMLTSGQGTETNPYRIA